MGETEETTISLLCREFRIFLECPLESFSRHTDHLQISLGPEDHWNFSSHPEDVET